MYTDKETMVKEIEAIMHDKRLTYWQRSDQLAKYASNILDYPKDTPEEFYRLKANGEICDLGEGRGPYSARYIIPDYEKFLKEGSEFLRLGPATNLMEATNNLLIFYHNAHGLDRFVVFIGRLDVLLEPFVKDMNYEEAKNILRYFLINIDRTLSDSFIQANLGPYETITGNIILELLAELQNITPNVSLRYDPEITPDSFASKAIETSLKCANPAFAYDKFYRENVGENYAIASCYNGLLIGGGAFTLTRLRLGTIASHSTSVEDFFENKLPLAIDTQLKFMDAKIKNLMENRVFFDTDFVVTEGFVSKDKFVGLFGIVGLCECVNNLMKLEGNDYLFGPDKYANDMGVKVLDFINEKVNNHENKYSYKNHFVMHAQVGTGEDANDSPGTRIKVGQEIDLYPHLKQCGLYHKYFPSGVGDIFPFDETALRNPAAVLDIFKGGFKVGCKYLSTYLADGDLVRVTGYLIKKSEVEKYRQGKVVANDSVCLVPGQQDNNKIFDRKVASL